MKSAIKRVLAPGMALVVLLLAGRLMPAGAQASFTVQAESRLWIDGTSTVNTFTCATDDVEGVAHLRAGAAAADDEVRVIVAVDVETFDCGKRQMNRDFYEALKAENHPVIRFELDAADVLARPDAHNSPYRLRASGRLSIAGTEQPVTLILTGQQLGDGRVRVSGRQPLRMTDFGIEPPTALLGLIRAHDDIVVRFDLIAASEALTSTE